MRSLLSDVLRSICVENGWVYAVLWKLNCQNPMILMWEDAYYEGGVHMDDSFSVFRSQPFVSGQGEIFVNERKPGRAKFCTNDKLGMLVEKMKDQLHVVGRGIVGHVALMGTHKWIYQDTYINEGYACSSTVYGTPFENFADWHGQFAAGIQTVAVISVSPYGVLQCGSIQKMSETLSFVNHLKLMFMQFEGIETPAFEIAPVTPCLFQKLHMVNEADVYANDASNNFCVKEEGPFPSVGEIPGELLVGHHSSPFSTVLGTHESHSNLHGVIYGDACVVSSVPKSNIPANEADVDSFIPKALLSSNSNIAPSCHMETVSSREDPEANSIASMHLNQYLSQRSDTLYSTSMGTCVDTTIDQNFDSLVSLNCAHGLMVPSEVSSSVHSINGVVDPMNGFCEALYTDSSVVWNSMHREPSDPPHNNRYQYENSVSVPLSSAVNDSKTCDIHSSCSRLQLTRPSNESEIQCMLGSTDSDLFQAIGSSFSASFFDKCDSFKRELSEIMPEFMQNTVANDIQQMPKGNFQPIKIEPEASNSLTVTAGGEISETNKPINNSLDRLPLDIQISNSQTGYKSTILNLKSVEDSGTGSGFSSFISDSNAGPMSNMLNDVQIDTSCFSESRTDDLLDAIVSSVQSYTNRSCNKCISANTLLGGVCSSNSSDDKLDVVAGLSLYPTKSEMVTANYCSLSEGSASKQKRYVSEWNFKISSVKHDNTRMPHTGMSEESPKSKQKRPKPGESTRPRPKDRQLIQDRVKELREIVPNGAKCSIDALLERTIKHMLFLQSVTKHADKLKNTGKSKLISKDGAWPLLLKDNFGGGATWAFEVGSKSMICPIIVEDLNVPHQMLVEMLCEERGFFLEIAELIRQMGLTILKGVMEMREDKIWAHFSVEANRDISRMEVFMSLVHLLDQISNSTTPKDTGSKIPVS